MIKNDEVDYFLSQYGDVVLSNGLQLRALLLSKLPGITEQIDLPAKMIAYCYGQKYIQLICVIIPSKKGIKLGFNRGIELTDPNGLLKGTGKISRYVEIKTEEDIQSPALKKLIANALNIYKSNTKIVK